MEVPLKPVLLDWIESTVTQMRTTEEGEARPFSGIMSALRELQLKLHPLIFTNADHRTRFIAFFLNAYVDNVFMDLLGDIPDDRHKILQGIREKLFGDIAEQFDRLLESLRKGDDPSPTLAGLVASYADAVSGLNFIDLKGRG